MPSMKKGNMFLLGDKLLLFKAMSMGSKIISLSIVPTSLRRTPFDHYCGGPSGAHMGEYKTLYCIWIQFFWPGLREEIKKWVAAYSHCVSYNVRRTRASELHFSWPVTVPFWIIHVDLWSPGLTEDSSGQKIYLLNCMCDLTRCIVSSITTSTDSSTFAQIFMSEVVLSFGMCSMVVIDDGSTFKSVFILMCTELKTNFWCLSRGNHRGNSVERYHRFRNKTQAIAGTDRGTHFVILQTAKTSQYAWNNAPIDNTDIARSEAAIGPKLRFLLDVELSPTPNLNNVHNIALFSYLHNVYTDSNFALSVLQILIKDRRNAHMDRYNKDKLICNLKVGDVVKAHVKVNSVASKGFVSKLSYKAKEPLVITADLGNNSFEVQSYDGSHFIQT